MNAFLVREADRPFCQTAAASTCLQSLEVHNTAASLNSQPPYRLPSGTVSLSCHPFPYETVTLLWGTSYTFISASLAAAEVAAIIIPIFIILTTILIVTQHHVPATAVAAAAAAITSPHAPLLQLLLST
eukprot:scaffold49014_cov16-Tisochrysis_lutea.AAC.6